MAKCPEGHIAIKTALSAVDSLTADLTKAHKTFARDELKSLLMALADSQEFVEIDMLRHFLSGFKDAIETGDASSLLVQKGLRVKRVVDVEEFVESKFFLGQKDSVWPSTMQILWDIFHGPDSDNIVEVVLGGATGVGKSMLSDLGIAYLLYKLSCLHNPQEFYGLAGGTSIYLLFQSVNLQSAKKVLFEQFSQRLRQSEYFRRYFAHAKEITTELHFPNNIRVLPVSSTDSSCLGLTVFACFPPEQQYLKADGSLGVLGDEEESIVLTIDPSSGDIFPAKYSSKAVPMGEKELFELTFDNGDTILCTNNQKFLGEDGVWFRASDATGRSFRYASLPNLWERTSLSDGPSEEHSRNDQFGISKDVSFSENVLQNSDPESTSKVEGNGYCGMLGVREAVGNDRSGSSSDTQHDCCGVRSKVSECSHEARIGCSKVGGEVQGTCLEATSRPGVQEVSTEGDSQSRAFRSGEYGEEEKRPGVYAANFPKCEGPLCKTISLRTGAQYLDSNAGQEEGNGLGICGNLCTLRVPGTGNEGTVLKDGSSISFLAGHERHPLGVRAATSAILFRGEEAHVPAGLSYSWGSYRGEGESVFESPQDPCETTSGGCSASPLFGNDADFKGFGVEHSLQLSESRKDQGNIIRDVEESLSSVTCVRVSKVVRTCVVYDIDCVPETHAFFVKTQRGFLVSHNSVIDELAFMDRVENSAKTKYTGESEYDQASSMYNTMANRIQSRFLRKGKIPGKLFLSSSANYPGDFLDTRIKHHEQLLREGKTSNIYVSVRTRWDAWPKGTFSTETFPVEVGDSTRRSKVLASASEAIDPGSILWVPIDFKQAFQSDCEKAIREIGGIPVGTSGAFLKEREKIHLASKEHVKVHEGKSLFKLPKVDLTYYEANLGVLFNADYLDTYIDTLAEYYVHLDLATTGDSCGISVGHLAGLKQCGKSFEYDEGARTYVETKGSSLPITIIDGTLEVYPPEAGEIDFIKIGDMLELLATKINITYITADSFQSVMMLQRLRKVFNCKGAKIKAATLSVDASMAPYAILKQSLSDGRLLYPDVDKLLQELRDLQIDPIRKKIDHPPKGSKDLSDSVAGVVYVVNTIGARKRTLNNAGEGQNTFRRIRSGRKQQR